MEGGGNGSKIAQTCDDIIIVIKKKCNEEYSAELASNYDEKMTK